MKIEEFHVELRLTLESIAVTTATYRADFPPASTDDN